MGFLSLIKPQLISGRWSLHLLAARLRMVGGTQPFGVIEFMLGSVRLGRVVMLRFHRDLVMRYGQPTLVVDTARCGQ